MKYTISKEFHFEASHRLIALPPGHPCTRPHGHSYVLRVDLESTELVPPGFVQDYRQLDPIKQFIDSEFDHQDLNEVFESLNPGVETTAENIAKFIFDRFVEQFPLISAVHVSETRKSLASFLR